MHVEDEVRLASVEVGDGIKRRCRAAGDESSSGLEDFISNELGGGGDGGAVTHGVVVSGQENHLGRGASVADRSNDRLHSSRPV